VREYTNRDKDGVRIDMIAVGVEHLGIDDGVLAFALILQDVEDPGHVVAALCRVSQADGASCQEDSPGSGFLEHFPLTNILIWGGSG
jgi:hypothetical protein